jgi:Uma2 family endonuclease
MASPRPDAGAPPLEAGDRLSLAEFERRYLLHPEIRKAELIDGVVYMPSPARMSHATPHATLIGWLFQYAAATPGTRVATEATTRLGGPNEVQPDAVLFVDPAHGGACRLTPDDYLEGPPELVVEVAASSAAYDLHAKRQAYARAGVREYLVALAYERELRWWRLAEGDYEPLAPDPDGLWRSGLFPGLWLDAGALWRDDTAAVLVSLATGLAGAEHDAFARQLAEAAAGETGSR